MSISTNLSHLRCCFNTVSSAQTNIRLKGGNNTNRGLSEAKLTGTAAAANRLKCDDKEVPHIRQHYWIICA